MGNVYSIFATFAYATSHFLAQIVILASTEIPKLEIGFVRCIIQASMVIPFLLLNRVNIAVKKDNIPLLVSICIAAYINMSANYFAFSLVPLSTTLTISATCPVFAILFGRWILKERCVWIDIAAGVLSFIGVLFIARPAFLFGRYGAKEQFFYHDMSSKNYELVYLAGCGLATVIAISKALLLNLSRKWSKVCENEGKMLIVNFYIHTVTGILLSLTLLFTGNTFVLPRPLYARCALFAVGMLTAFGGFALYISVKLQNAGVISILRNLDILYAYFLEYLVMNITPSLWSVGGAVAIILSTVLVFFRERAKRCCGESEVNMRE